MIDVRPDGLAIVTIVLRMGLEGCLGRCQSFTFEAGRGHDNGEREGDVLGRGKLTISQCQVLRYYADEGTQ